jgi:hypothetical protein
MCRLFNCDCLLVKAKCSQSPEETSLLDFHCIKGAPSWLHSNFTCVTQWFPWGTNTHARNPLLR